jgi:hypothetical protein
MSQGQVFMFYSIPSGGGCPPQPQQQQPCPPQQQPLIPPSANRPHPTPDNGGKGKGKGKGKRKGKSNSGGMAPAASVGVAAPPHGPPSMIPELAPSPCGQGCALLNNQCNHRSMLCALHQCNTHFLQKIKSCQHRSAYKMHINLQYI